MTVEFKFDSKCFLRKEGISFDIGYRALQHIAKSEFYSAVYPFSDYMWAVERVDGSLMYVYNSVDETIKGYYFPKREDLSDFKLK